MADRHKKMAAWRRSRGGVAVWAAVALVVGLVGLPGTAQGNGCSTVCRPAEKACGNVCVLRTSVCLDPAGTACNAAPNPAYCRLVPQKGSGSGSVERWYHNVAEDSCMRFTWGGAADGSNLNRFESEEACQAVCPTGNVADTTPGQLLPGQRVQSTSATQQRVQNAIQTEEQRAAELARAASNAAENVAVARNQHAAASSAAQQAAPQTGTVTIARSPGSVTDGDVQLGTGDHTSSTAGLGTRTLASAVVRAASTALHRLGADAAAAVTGTNGTATAAAGTGNGTAAVTNSSASNSSDTTATTTAATEAAPSASTEGTFVAVPLALETAQPVGNSPPPSKQLPPVDAPARLQAEAAALSEPSGKIVQDRLIASQLDVLQQQAAEAAKEEAAKKALAAADAQKNAEIQQANAAAELARDAAEGVRHVCPCANPPPCGCERERGPCPCAVAPPCPCNKLAPCPTSADLSLVALDSASGGTHKGTHLRRDCTPVVAKTTICFGKMSCPFAEAVCCEDQVTCCPYGYKCVADVSGTRCAAPDSV